MIDERFVFLGLLIQFLGIASYLWGTLKGQVKPNKVSFFLWSIAPLIAFAAELSEGVGIQSLMTFSVGFSPLLVFLASFVNKKAEWKLNKFDLTCGVFSVIGLVLWYFTKIGNVAVAFSILADGLAFLPTLRKSYYYPETESPWAYLASAINALLTILTIRVLNFANFGFPVYIFLVDVIGWLLIQFKLGKLMVDTKSRV